MGAERERFVTVEERLHVEAVWLSITVNEVTVSLPQWAAACPRCVPLDRFKGFGF